MSLPKTTNCGLEVYHALTERHVNTFNRLSTHPNTHGGAI